MDYKLFSGHQHTNDKKYPEVLGNPQNKASDSYPFQKKLFGLPNKIQMDNYATPNNYFREVGQQTNLLLKNQEFQIVNDINFYQGKQTQQAPQNFDSNYYQEDSYNKYNDTGNYGNTQAYNQNCNDNEGRIYDQQVSNEYGFQNNNALDYKQNQEYENQGFQADGYQFDNNINHGNLTNHYGR